MTEEEKYKAIVKDSTPKGASVIEGFWDSNGKDTCKSMGFNAKKMSNRILRYNDSYSSYLTKNSTK